MNTQNFSEKTDGQNEYKIWREGQNVWVTENKTFTATAKQGGNEYAAYKAAAAFLGTLVFACAVIHFLFMPIIPIILNAFPVDFGFDFWSDKYFGDPDIVYSLDILNKSLGFIAIILGGIIGHKLPKDVLFNSKVRSKSAFLAAIPVALALGAIYVLLVNATGAKAPMERFDFPPSVQNLIVFLVLPILAELAFRGVLLFFFRQYGDLAAIITVSTAAAVLQFDIRLVPATMIVSAVLCYFALTAENVIVPIIMHFIMNVIIGLFERGSPRGQVAGVVFSGDLDVTAGVLLLYAVCFAAGIFGAAYLLSHPPEIIETETSRDPLKTSDKLFCMFTSVPVIIAITSLVIIALL
jgi:membrane protease YdiL (CAAX protease family)